MFSHLVRPELCSTECLVTDIADIFLVFLLSVGVVQVVAQLSPGRESLGAEIADKISSIQICFMNFLHVSLEVPNLLEQLPALLTAELLDTGVDQVMCLQLVLQSELLMALRTLELKERPSWRWLAVSLTLSQMFVCLDFYDISCPLIANFTEIELFLRGVVPHKVFDEKVGGSERSLTNTAGLLSQPW